MTGVISGRELKDIRARAGMGNQQLADLLGESLSTVNRWLANGVRPEKEPKVRERLATWLPQTEPDRYVQMSDAALLAEMTRLLGIIGQRLANYSQLTDIQTDSEKIENSDRQAPRAAPRSGWGPLA